MKILLTTQFLRNFTGSEVVMFELAREFVSKNHDVTLAAFELKNPLLEKLKAIPVKVMSLPQVEGKFDLIWSQHFPTIEHLVSRKISAAKIIFSSLSPYEPLESPPACFDKMTLFLANSDETKQTMVEMGLEADQVLVFPNPAPQNFFNYEIRKNSELKKIAVVSNTVQPVLEECAQILEREGICMDFVGIKKTPKLVTPEVLGEYDAVITIGKTVQYCLALGIPVFVYDRFGGCGYLNKENIERAKWFNFSGRCSGVILSAGEIASRVREGFRHYDRNFLRGFARDHFQIEKNLNHVLRRLLLSKSEKKAFLLNNIMARRARLPAPQVSQGKGKV